MSHDGDKIYIGSTTKKLLSMRMSHHRSGYKQWKEGKTNKTSSYELFDEYGVEKCFIVLIELYPCSNKDERNARETHFIKSLSCVNKVIPTTFKAEFNEEFKAKMKITNKEYKEKHKERLKEYTNTPFKCDCGGRYNRNAKMAHFRTMMHITYLETAI